MSKSSPRLVAIHDLDQYRTVSLYRTSNITSSMLIGNCVLM